MTRNTKIVATIGPASESEEMIRKLIQVGVNVFRFNFKHNTIDWHSQIIQRVNAVADQLHASIGTLIDLQGPEIRITMPKETLTLHKDDRVVFGPEAFELKSGLSISHPDIITHLKDGQKIVVDNGAFHFILRKGTDGKSYLESRSEGILKNKKSLNIPGADFPLPVLVDRDFEGLKLALRHKIDFVALSFVRTAEDIRVVRREMKKFDIEAKVFAKIETEKALKNLDAIIDESDGIMVARGDLGVEMPIEQVPYYQKIIIKQSILKGVPVITATQMLESMIEHPYPTRAEISDVANATYDLTDAVMLSAESASGAYPVESVSTMNSTVTFNEKKNMVDSRLRFNFPLDDQEAMLCHATYGLYYEYLKKGKKIDGFLVFSETGRTINLLSRYRPLSPIYACTTNQKVGHSLILNYGVISFTQKEVEKNSLVKKEQIVDAINYLVKEEFLKKGDTIIVLSGDKWSYEGGTSTIKLITV